MAVLPIHDDRLFRVERAELRALLAGELARRAPDYAILPLAEVDTRLQPISSTTRARCAFEDVPAERRASSAGWLSTDVFHVGNAQGKPEELWVQLGGRHRTEVTFTGLWDPRLDPAARYRGAFGSLQRQTEGGGLIGGLGLSGSPAGIVREGAVTLCETRQFGACEPESSSWRDRLGDLAGCYAGEDELENELLVDGSTSPARCELTNVDDLQGRDGQREACLCRALSTSSGVRAKAGRRVLRLSFEAPDLTGKPRAEVRVVDATTNLPAEEDWHSMSEEAGGKTVRSSVRRLVVEHLDALVAPLARCGAQPGSVMVAALQVAENGAVTAARVVAGSAGKETTGCIEKALSRGTFECTEDGKPAMLRVAFTWPAVKP